MSEPFASTSKTFDFHQENLPIDGLGFGQHKRPLQLVQFKLQMLPTACVPSATVTIFFEAIGIFFNKVIGMEPCVDKACLQQQEVHNERPSSKSIAWNLSGVGAVHID
jgi:hypothetical protein